MKTTTLSTTCQICEQPIEKLTDSVYVNWGLTGTKMARPQHKACAQQQYERNRRHADGYVECIECGAWVLDLTAKRLDGRCRTCHATVEAQADAVTQDEQAQIDREMAADQRTPEQRDEDDQRLNELCDASGMPVCEFYGFGYACFHCGQPRDDAARILGLIRARATYGSIL